MILLTSRNLLNIRNRVVSRFLRLFIFSLSIAAFGSTSLQAQVVAYVTPGNFPFAISVIDTAKPGQGVLSTIPMGASSGGVVFSPDGTRAYVANPAHLNILVI